MNRIPSRASPSICGVRISLPKQPMSEYPMSSATMTTMFGRDPEAEPAAEAVRHPKKAAARAQGQDQRGLRRKIRGFSKDNMEGIFGRRNRCQGRTTDCSST